MPNSGTITVHGEKIAMGNNRRGVFGPTDMKQVERIRSSLAMVFQSFNLWSHMTVLENVIEGPIHVLHRSKTEARERALYILNRVGMYEHRNYSLHIFQVADNNVPPSPALWLWIQR